MLISITKEVVVMWMPMLNAVAASIVALFLVCCADVQSPSLCAGVVCEDENGCTVDSCNPVDGTCLNVEVDDGAFCDFDGAPGQCGAGVCENAALCNDAPVRCNDENECTEDLCNASNGQCSNDAGTDGVSCDFGGDPGICTNGVCDDAMLCSGMDCNDEESCTTDTCDPGTGICGHEPRTDTCQSQSGSFFFLGDCMNGTCVLRSCALPFDCDDNNECTQDGCDSNGQCIITKLNSGSCNFGTGMCSDGICRLIIMLSPPILP